MSAAGGPPETSDEEARARALALLEATHSFPCAYSVTVIAFNSASVTAEVRRVAYDSMDDSEGVGAGSHQSQESQGGKYVSHRLAVPVPDARSVLELYARLRVIEGVVTLL